MTARIAALVRLACVCLCACLSLAAPSNGLATEACPRIRDIGTWSFYDRPGEDDVFDRLRFSSDCDSVLAAALKSRTPMPYDWYNQIFLECDAAIFLLLRKYELHFLDILPSEEHEAWRNQGIFSYFDYVERDDHNRDTLIVRLLELVEKVKQGRPPPKRNER